jgi:hypothetical protein
MLTGTGDDNYAADELSHFQIQTFPGHFNDVSGDENLLRSLQSRSKREMLSESTTTLPT